MTAEEYCRTTFNRSPKSLSEMLSEDEDFILSFFNKVQLSLSEDTEEELKAHLEQAEISAEKLIAGNVSRLFSDTLIHLPEIKDEYMFLKEDVANEIINEIPPPNLNLLIESGAAPELDTACKKLAVTRFTENKEWQHNYQKKLAQTIQSDYQKRQMELLTVETSTLLQALLSSKNTIKPWRSSHSKENGLIILFNEVGPDLHLSNLLVLSVLLHYLHEVRHFSSYIQSHPHFSYGEVAVNVIKGKYPELDFLHDGNAHDETDYWRKAVQNLNQLELLDAHLIEKNYLSFNSKNGKSGNFIDWVWNANQVNGKSKHIYHLQQECWLQLLEHVSRCNRDEFEQMVFEAISMDNLAFLSRVLK